MTEEPDLSDLSDDFVLTLLDEERKKFTGSNRAVMEFLVEELQRRGVYPQETVEGNPNSVFTMVEGWGARWHLWSDDEECPHCKADLRDHKAGPPFSRKFGMTYVGQDYTAHYVCPDCDKNIPRFAEGDSRAVTGI